MFGNSRAAEIDQALADPENEDPWVTCGECDGDGIRRSPYFPSNVSACGECDGAGEVPVF